MRTNQKLKKRSRNDDDDPSRNDNVLIKIAVENDEVDLVKLLLQDERVLNTVSIQNLINRALVNNSEDVIKLFKKMYPLYSYVIPSNLIGSGLKKKAIYPCKCHFGKGRSDDDTTTKQIKPKRQLKSTLDAFHDSSRSLKKPAFQFAEADFGNVQFDNQFGMDNVGDFTKKRSRDLDSDDDDMEQQQTKYYTFEPVSITGKRKYERDSEDGVMDMSEGDDDGDDDDGDGETKYGRTIGTNSNLGISFMPRNPYLDPVYKRKYGNDGNDGDNDELMLSNDLSSDRSNRQRTQIAQKDQKTFAGWVDNPEDEIWEDNNVEDDEEMPDQMSGLFF